MLLDLFIEMQARKKHTHTHTDFSFSVAEKKRLHWHHDITFYSLNCVHTHRFRSQRPTSTTLVMEKKKTLYDFSTMHTLCKREAHVNRVKTSSGAIKVILCFHFWFCISYSRAILCVLRYIRHLGGGIFNGSPFLLLRMNVFFVFAFFCRRYT